MIDLRVFARLLIMTVAVSISAIAITTGVLYFEAVKEREDFLLEVARRTRQQILALYQYESVHIAEKHPEDPEHNEKRTFEAIYQVIQNAKATRIFGKTIEIVSATLEGDKIHFISAADMSKIPDSVKMGSKVAIPMQLALQGKTGSIKSTDYAGRKIVAGYTQVNEIGLGIVAKSFLGAINESYIVGAVMAVLPALLVVMLGAWYFWQAAGKIIGQLRKDNLRYKCAMEKLSESEQRLQSILDATFEGVAITQGGILIDGNQRFAEILGYTFEEMKDRPISDFVHPDDAEMVMKKILEDYTEAYEHRSITKDGKTVYVEVHGQLSQLGGEKLRITAVHDITERRELALYKRQAIKMEAIGNFASGIVHDFNNALTPIIGNCDLLLLKVKDDNDTRDRIRLISAAAETAHQLVRRIQTFTKADPDPEEEAPLKIDACVKEAFDFLRSITPTTIDMNLSTEAGLGYVSTNDVMIRQILMNLVKNSTQAIGNRTGQIAVRVSNDTIMVKRFNLKPGQYVKIEVEDNGCGMPEEVLERAMDPYFSTKGAEGSGLGLAVIRGILDQHGGCIFLQSTAALGTKATIYLPALKTQGPIQEYCEIELAIPMGAHQRVIVIDDEQYVVDITEKMLASLDYEALGYDSPEEALDEIKLNPKAFEVVISDLTMPVMSGIVVLQEVKKINPDVKTILSSGIVEDVQKRSEKYDDFIDAYLQKPSTRRQIAEVLASVLH